MAERLSTPGYVPLWAGWTIPLPPCTTERNKDGSFSAWGSDWAVDVTIVECGNDAAGNPISATRILGDVGQAIKISGNGWIGSMETLNESDNGKPVTRLATKLCAQNTFMSCWVSYTNDKFAPLADAIVKNILHRPA